MVVHAKTRWQIAVTFGVLGASALLRYGLGLDGGVLAALALVPVVVAVRMRLSADEEGVTIVNLGRRIRIPWAQITDFRLGRAFATTGLGVYRGDGRRVNAWVVTTAGAGSSSGAKVYEITAELRRRLALRTGEPSSAIDERAASNLVAERRIDVHEMAERLLHQAMRAREQS